MYSSSSSQPKKSAGAFKTNFGSLKLLTRDFALIVPPSRSNYSYPLLLQSRLVAHTSYENLSAMSDGQETSTVSLTAHTQDSQVQDAPASDATAAVQETNPLPKNNRNTNNAPKESEDVATPASKKGSMVIITVSLGMATFLAALDVAVVTTALPYIASDLHASQTGYSWIGSAYLLTYAAMGPFWAKSSDILGRKPALLAANIVFFVGSLVCALSSSVGMLIAGRAIQGAGGGGLIVLVNITLGDLVSMR